MSSQELVTELDINRERPVITEAIAEQAKTDVDLQEKLAKRLQVPWYSVQEAIDMGYIIPGWNLIDYIRSTWRGYPDDIPNPLHPERPRMRFHAVHLWGEQGCISRETEIVTGEGIQMIGDLTEGEEFSLPSYRNGSTERDVGVMINSGIQMLYLVRTDTGKTVCATEQHPFLTLRGWMKTAELRRGMSMIYMTLERGETSRRPRVTGVLSVDPIGRDRTFNLHVLKNNNFLLSNGIVTHNTAKSNFASQILGLSYGAYSGKLNPKFSSLQEQRKVAWDWCQKMMIVNKEDLISVYGLVTKTSERLKIVVLDDINSIFSKQLWREDAELYMKLFKMLGMIRRKVGTLMTTEPNIEFLQRALGDITTIEALATPNGSYKVERYSHDVHPYFKLKDKVTKVMIEYAKFNIYDVPTWWWDIYQERTNAEGNKGFNDVVEYMGNEGEDDIKSTLRTLQRQDVPLNEIVKTLRSAGLKGSQEQLLEAAKLIKTKQSERAEKVLSEKTIVMTDEKL